MDYNVLLCFLHILSTFYKINLYEKNNKCACAHCSGSDIATSSVPTDKDDNINAFTVLIHMTD